MAGILSFLPGILKGVGNFSKSLGQHENFGTALSKGIEGFVNPNQPPPPQPYIPPPNIPPPSQMMPTRNATDYMTQEEDMRRMEMAPKKKVDMLLNNAGHPQIKTMEVPEEITIKEEVNKPTPEDIEKEIEDVEDQIFRTIGDDEMRKEDVENKFDIIEENIDAALRDTDEPREDIYKRELIEKKKILNSLGANIPSSRRARRRRLR